VGGVSGGHRADAERRPDVTPDVTVSIVNHSNRAAVLAGLAVLLHEPDRRAAVEVVVVDNASDDGSVEAVQARHPDVRVLARPERHGFGANHNAALVEARGGYVLLLNDDTVVCPGTIDRLVGYLDAHPAVALVGPRVVDERGATQRTAWPLPSTTVDVLQALTLHRLPATQSRGRRPRRVGWVMGACLMGRVPALCAVGGFDEGFYMYSEEVDLCARLARAGWETHWVPDAVVVHEGQRSTGATSRPRAVEMARSRRRYWRTHSTAAAGAVSRLAVTAEFVVLAVGAALTRRPWRPFLWQAVGCWTDPGGPGLRERAAEWNEAARREAAPNEAARRVVAGDEAAGRDAPH